MLSQLFSKSLLLNRTSLLLPLSLGLSCRVASTYSCMNNLFISLACCVLCAEAILPENTLGYLQVFLDGGLNQQRMGVSNVTSAYSITETLLIPYNSF